MSDVMTQDDQQKAKQGVILAVAAYTMWGVAPIYFKALGDVSPLEILSHRVFWSFFFAGNLAPCWASLAECKGRFQNTQKAVTSCLYRHHSGSELAYFHLGSQRRPYA